MKQPSEDRIPTDIRRKLTELCLSLLEVFRIIKSKLDYAERAAHAIYMDSEPGFGGLVRDELAKQLRETKAFEGLVNFLLEEEVLWRKFVPDAPDSPRKIHMFRLYAGAIMLRVVDAADASVVRHKRQVVEFVDFLDSPDVVRRVWVPVFHLDLAQDSYDLGDFGTLTKSASAPTEILPGYIAERLESIPRSVLSFSVRTGHFLNADDFPLSEVLKAKISLLRLAVYPLIGYNHFVVAHVRPWELRIEDEDFSSRHWSRPGSIGLSVKRRVLTDDDAERIKSLRESFGGMGWETMSPWRLAMDRLDDAIFKLECGSPDAILDLVIGLESLFIDRDSRQESTHKVAIRVSRFLEELLPTRKELFLKVKQIYKDRSTLAHGQRWNLDDHGVSRVEEAASILARALRKMVELQCVELDHETLDLS